jgi:mRNA interferase MazF
MKESEIVLTPILQANGQLKNRPALILRVMPPFQDFLVCGISTRLHQKVEDFNEIISQNADDFAESGLVADSLIRLGFPAVLPSAKIIGSIGSVSTKRRQKLLSNLSNYLIKNISV